MSVSEFTAMQTPTSMSPGSPITPSNAQSDAPNPYVDVLSQDDVPDSDNHFDQPKTTSTVSFAANIEVIAMNSSNSVDSIQEIEEPQQISEYRSITYGTTLMAPISGDDDILMINGIKLKLEKSRTRGTNNTYVAPYKSEGLIHE